MNYQHAKPQTLIASEARLTLQDASAAIILLEDSRYLLQLRDDKEEIWYPDHWGCFGGGVNSGEDPLEALRRELHEELGYDLQEARLFVRLDFDLPGLKMERCYRNYYLITMQLAEMRHLTLGEGKALAAFDGNTLLSSLRVTPYDAFVLFLHARGHRIGKV